jgi:nucleoside-diphosphate-sugar epimerase
MKRNVRVCIVRPSRLVHEYPLRNGFITQIIEVAKSKGFSAYTGDGSNRTQAVHRLDTARLFCLALEKGTAGSRYQAVADGNITFREIAEAAGKRLKIPAISISAEEAVNHFEFLSQIMGMDNPASSEITQKALGWNPAHPSLLKDLEAD